MKTKAVRNIGDFSRGFRGVLEPLPFRMIEEPASQFPPAANGSESERGFIILESGV